MPQAEEESTGSITVMIEQLRGRGDSTAANKLFQRYFEQLVAKLRCRVNRKVQAAEDSEDAAQYALAEVLGNLVEGRYPNLADRESLWALLVHIGDLRTKQVWRYSTAKRRDVRKLQGQLAMDLNSETPEAFDPSSDTISASMLVEMEDMIEHLARQFSKKEYKNLLILELQGNSAAEIRQRLEIQLQRPVAESSLRRWRRLMREELRACYPEEYPQGEVRVPAEYTVPKSG
jgi:DNA-directed RNA polymerase specialized sigma24 family protein